MSLRRPLPLLLAVMVFATLGGCAQSGSEVAGVNGNVTAAVCGNGVRDVGEQCDDGNLTSLDGCSSTCTFEQVQRINSVTVLFGPDGYCPANAIGSAFRSPAQGTAQSTVTDAVNSGLLSELFEFPGLADLTGRAAQRADVRLLSGAPVGADAGYQGSSDPEGWYTAYATSVNDAGQATAQMPAVLDGGVLNVGPGDLAFSLHLGSAQVTLDLTSVKAKATVGAASVPTASSTGHSPGHRASEHLDPALQSFASLLDGELCGNIRASSLAAAPVLPQLRSGGSIDCSEGYTDQNTMLDVLVGGCKKFFITGIGATQPDQVSPTAPSQGAGGPYRFVADGSHHVTGCQDVQGSNVPLAGCLAAAEYSVAGRFTTERVMVVGVQPAP